jgi:hypothetical protein
MGHGRTQTKESIKIIVSSNKLDFEENKMGSCWEGRRRLL